MNSDDLSDWTHDHAFDSNSEVAERSTRLVMWITVVTMFVEILAGNTQGMRLRMSPPRNP